MKPAPIVFKFVVALLVFGWIVQPAPVWAADSPKDLWTVQSLIDRGLLDLDQVGDGSEPIDLYTFAVAIDRILEQIEAGTLRASEDDYRLLENLTNEFSRELTTLFADTKILTEGLSESEKVQIALDLRINSFIDKLSEIELSIGRIEANMMQETENYQNKLAQANAELEQLLQKQVSGLSESQDAEIRKLQVALESLGKTIDVAKKELNDQGNEIADYRIVLELYQDDVNAFKEDFGILKESFTATDLWLAELQNMAAKTRDDLADFQKETSNQLGKLDELKGIVQDIEKNVGNLTGSIESKTRTLTTSIDQLDAQIKALEFEIVDLSSQVGISEEELKDLRTEIRDDILVDLNHVSLETKRLAYDLSELKDDFETYKKVSEKEIKSAKSTAYIGIAAAVIGIVVSIMNMGK